MLNEMYGKATESRSGLTDLSTRVSGLTIRRMVKEDSYIQMVTYIKEIGLMTRPKGSEFTLTWMEPSI
jgi:hypothetical protein